MSNTPTELTIAARAYRAAADRRADVLSSDPSAPRLDAECKRAYDVWQAAVAAAGASGVSTLCVSLSF